MATVKHTLVVGLDGDAPVLVNLQLAATETRLGKEGAELRYIVESADPPLFVVTPELVAALERIMDYIGDGYRLMMENEVKIVRALLSTLSQEATRDAE